MCVCGCICEGVRGKKNLRSVVLYVIEKQVLCYSVIPLNRFFWVGCCKDVIFNLYSNQPCSAVAWCLFITVLFI